MWRSKMTKEKFIEIMKDDMDCDWEGCNVFSGLKIITKYCPKRGIEGAEHDMIYSVSIEELIDAGIIEEDVIELKKLNWMVEEGEYLACFV
jgi:hypothetical protein